MGDAFWVDDDFEVEWQPSRQRLLQTSCVLHANLRKNKVL